MEDFELRAYDLELHNLENYEDWLALRKNQFKLYPRDYSTRYRLAEALVLTKNYKEALKHLKAFHNEEPDDDEFNQLILDALRGLEKGIDTFEWKSKPKTLALNDKTESKIIENMKSKRKRKQRFSEVYVDLMSDLLQFDENGLFKHLKESQKFNVEGMQYSDAIVIRKQ